MKLRWPHGLAAVALLIGAVAAIVFCIFEFGIAQRWVRNSLVQQLEERTGARVELGGFHLHAWRLRAELDNLTLHGLETFQRGSAVSRGPRAGGHHRAFVSAPAI